MSGPATTRLEPSAPLEVIDTHCHLDDDAFAADLDLVLQRATRSGVSRWINVGYSPGRWQPSLDLVEAHPGLSCMLGVHPGHASEWSAETDRRLRGLLNTGIPVAVGEIGLDFYRGETNVAEQVRAFTQQLALAQEYGLPASLHLRNAEELVIEVLDSQLVLPPLLFHSFEGGDPLVDWILRNDAWIGVGGLATRGKAAGLRASIARIGLDRIVLETDSPYLVPNGFKHRRNTPESIPYILRALAELFGVDGAVVARQTTENAHRIFRSLPSV